MQTGQFESRLRKIMGAHEEALRCLLIDVCAHVDSKNTSETGNLGTTGLRLDEPEQKTEHDGPSEEFMHLSSSTCPTMRQSFFTENVSHHPIASRKLDDLDNVLDLQEQKREAVDLFPEEEKLEEFVKETSNCRKIAEEVEMFRIMLGVWDKMHEPSRVGCLADVLQSSKFETVVFAIIFLNCALTVVATNMAMSSMSGTRPVGMRIAEEIFLVCYMIELILKLFVHRQYFFCNHDAGWNTFDLCLVVNDLVDRFLALHDLQGYSMAFGRTIRVLKITRVLRFVRMVQFLSELRLMLDCLMRSVASVMWSLILLALLTFMFAIALVQHLAHTMSSDDSGLSTNVRLAIIEYFGSVEQATLTLFMSISGGMDWESSYNIIKHSGTFGSVMYICYIVFMWLSVTNIITSIFVDKALKLAKPDLEDRMLEVCRDNLDAAEDLKKLFRAIDVDGSEALTREEFKQTQKNVLVQEFFQMRGLSITHIDMFFEMLVSASPDERIDMSTFVSGCLRMRGHATNIEVMSLDHRLQILSNLVGTHIDEYRRDIRDLQMALNSKLVR